MTGTREPGAIAVAYMFDSHGQPRLIRILSLNVHLLMRTELVIYSYLGDPTSNTDTPSRVIRTARCTTKFY